MSIFIFRSNFRHRTLKSLTSGDDGEIKKFTKNSENVTTFEGYFNNSAIHISYRLFMANKDKDSRHSRHDVETLDGRAGQKFQNNTSK